MKTYLHQKGRLDPLRRRRGAPDISRQCFFEQISNWRDDETVVNNIGTIGTDIQTIDR